jgi:ribosome-associated protein
MIRITPDISVREAELKLDFIRASGPGGQNVNKVATAVQLRFDVFRSPSLPEDVRRRLVRIAGKRVSKEGVLLIDARRFRTQEEIGRTLWKAHQWIRRAAEKPKSESKPGRPRQRERRLKANASEARPSVCKL